MSLSIAFLRAVNVGGRTVKMDALRALLTQNGYTRVETFIASGNVIFATPPTLPGAVETHLEALLKAHFGFEVTTFVRSMGELAQADTATPFTESELAGHVLYVGFLKAAVSPESLARLLVYANEVDEFRIVDRTVYWLCRKTISESDFSGNLLEKALGQSCTLRNRTTVQKVLAKWGV